MFVRRRVRSPRNGFVPVDVVRPLRTALLSLWVTVAATSRRADALSTTSRFAVRRRAFPYRTEATSRRFATRCPLVRDNDVVRPRESVRLRLSPALASMAAGSIAGSIGVGVAFPLDTLKTKSQVYGAALSTTNTTTSTTTNANTSQLSMLELIGFVWRKEGIAGFFGGVKGMMAGQAVIKSVAFSSNAFALDRLAASSSTASPSFSALLIAASFSGLVASFFVSPIERVKVMMQAADADAYEDEVDCVRAVLRAEGWTGLLGRGLGPTLAREVPSYAIYFTVYGVLVDTPTAAALGPAAPLVFGALAGMACWLPVYPVDVVKTLVQNTEGDDDDRPTSTLDVARRLYREGGPGAFFDGLTPKMLRAGVNHSVTFWIYNLIIKHL